MKRVNLKNVMMIAIMAIGLVMVAQAQKIPLYSEVFDEHSKKLVSKEWRSAEGHLRQETPRADGTWNVTIYRADSLKLYEVVERTKTMAELTLSNQQIGGIARTSNSTREFLRREVVEGYDCAVYKVTKSSSLAGSQPQSNYHTEWYYEPLDLVIRYVESLNAMNLITRNIVQGQQPKTLFELPKDYKFINANAEMKQMQDMMKQMQNLQNQKK